MKRIWKMKGIQVALRHTVGLCGAPSLVEGSRLGFKVLSRGLKVQG